LEQKISIIEAETKNSLIGTREQVKEQLLSLDNEGITDVLITIFSEDKDSVMVYHKLLKEIIKGEY
jgi:alkanesulfonate monooxygenase SsuD/methylene tetrahydromethanopterin reductase-like flavin-dependent oxidoreductase (luciferase family)